MAIEPNNKNKNLRKYWLIRVTSLFILIGIVFFIYWFFIGRYYETTDDAYVSGNLVQVMPRISGRVSIVLADETNSVKKGQPLVQLDKTDEEIALTNAKSELAQTVRNVKNLYIEVDQLRSNVKLKINALQKAQNDYKRRQGLIVNKVISAEDLQHAEIAEKSAEDDVALAQSQLASAISLVMNTDLYHHPLIQQAAYKVRTAYLNLSRTTISAPESGYIAKRSVDVGEQVNANTVMMVIVPLDQVWINANFKESQLKHFRIGQPVEVISDLYGSDVKFHGTVAGLNPGTGSTFDLLPPQNATGNWIKIIQRLPVRIHLSSQELKEYPLRIGLSMTVTVNTHNRKGSALTKISQKEEMDQSQNEVAELKAADAIIQQIIISITPNMSITS